MTDKGIDKREESLRVFSQTAKIYDRIGPQIFFYFGQCLVDVADLNSGAKVLDVAAGRGALLFPVAAKVGTTGRVTAIDFSPDMVRETAKDIESRKLSNAEIRHMDAEQMNLPDASFDWIMCGFALCMFAEPARVLQEFYRVLKRWLSAPGPLIIRLKLGVMRCLDPLCMRRRKTTPCEIRLPVRHAVSVRNGAATGSLRGYAVEEKDFVYADEEQYWCPSGRLVSGANSKR